MSIIYRTTPNDDKALIYLEKLWQDNWIYCWPLGDKLVFRKEEKKQVKSRALTTESNKGISYLKAQRQKIDSWEEIHYPDFIDDRKEWTKFINYWTQKNSEDDKMHAEKQKTFDIRARWANWDKDKVTKANTLW